jgi:uncharacterized protein (DUF952 family)
MTTPQDEWAAGRIYHLTTRTEWDAALPAGVYDRSTRDRSLEDVGFIHCSLPSQLAAVAGFVYADCEDDLVVLVLDLPALEASGLTVRLEDGGNGSDYPHIYGALPCALVADVLPASFDGHGAFVF